MSLTEISALHVIHVGAILVLIGYTFFALAAPPETKKRVLIVTGCASLVVLLTGIRMWQGLYHFSGWWPVVKLICWLGLSALTGLAYRRRAQAGMFAWIAIVLAVVALVMVYFKPGM